MTIVELCAGSAAVSLRWLARGARPPLAYSGGKRGYADAILAALGQQPGAGKGQEAVLVEPGPWGEAWELWRTPQGRADTCERLRASTSSAPWTPWNTSSCSPITPAGPPPATRGSIAGRGQLGLL